ncbi:MAG: TetR family transcriptional regulator [Pseudobdellovibrionaceae bacterium]
MTKKMSSLRARKPEDKNAKRDLILNQGLRLFRSQDFDSIAMQQLALRSGLAKGTLYLYFQSKEEVFLACTEREFEKWISLLEARLNEISSPLSASQFADFFLGTLREFPELPKLLGHLHLILERNLSETAATDFKLRLKALLIHLAGLLKARTPSLMDQERALSFLMKCYSLLVGLDQVCNPSLKMQKVISNPELSFFQLDFDEQLREGICLLLLGYEKLESKTTYHFYGNY